MKHNSNIKMNYYSLYGMHIATELVLDELIQENTKPDLVINNGKAPNFLLGTTQSCAHFQAKENEFLTRIDKVGSFYASNGNRIICEPYQDADYMSIKMYLYGFLLPVILMQRSQFPMHGSCIEINHMAIIISGQSGAGKSSLGIAFRLAGYKLIADDIIALNDNWNEGLFAHYGFPIQKITSDTAKYLNIDTANLKRIPDEDKYLFPLKHEFQKNPVPLKALFEIVAYNGEEPILEELTGGEKLRCVIANTYNVEMIGIMGLAQEHFMYGTHLSKMIKVFRISRPVQDFTLNQQMDLILTELEKIDL